MYVHTALIVIILIVIILIIVFSCCATNDKTKPIKEGYGRADEWRAGLNPACPIDSAPYGWAGLQASGYRADSSSAISHMMLWD